MSRKYEKRNAHLYPNCISIAQTNIYYRGKAFTANIFIYVFNTKDLFSALLCSIFVKRTDYLTLFLLNLKSSTNFAT